MKRYFIIDFDSTFVTVETLDELSKIVLAKNPRKDKLLAEISKITKLGMEGEMPFDKSLTQRLNLSTPTKKHIGEFIKVLKKHITPSIRRNRVFFRLYKDYIYIISGGFSEYIAPVVAAYGIPKDHVLANSFVFDKKGKVVGYDRKNPLSKTGGKAKAVASLKLPGQVYVVGDGITDYEVRRSAPVAGFYAFIENIEREKVVSHADRVVKNLDEILYRFHLPRALSYPKSRIRVLLLENIHPEAVHLMSAEGYEVQEAGKAYTEDELLKVVDKVSILGIRSKTQITQRVLSAAKHLLAVGAFCIGTNQIDLPAAAENGTVVFNAPYSNTRSVVELIIGEIIMLMRGVFPKSQKLHQGVWDKSAKGACEVRGKTLGIVGYGNIGSQLSVIAESLGMKVLFYDLADKLAMGNARPVKSLKELLKNADVVTIHVDGRPENRNLISKKEFGEMKKGAIFLNASRGFVVDLEALADSIKSGQLAGAAVDVFPKEPHSKEEKFVSVLQGAANVILTPHIGGSTQEAQFNIGGYVARKIIQFVNTGSTSLSVNFPALTLPPVAHAHRLIHIHRNEPGVLSAINEVLASNKLNIIGQYLQTNAQVGYVITDVNKNYDEKVISKLKNVPETIRLRVLY